MKRLTDEKVFSGFTTAWRRAIWPTSFSPLRAKATTDGVVRWPSALGMMVGLPPSMAAMALLVVPRSAQRRENQRELDADARGSSGDKISTSARLAPEAAACVQGLCRARGLAHRCPPLCRCPAPRPRRDRQQPRRATSGAPRAAAARLGRCRADAPQLAARPRATRDAAEARQRARSPAKVPTRGDWPSQRARRGDCEWCRQQGAHKMTWQLISASKQCRLQVVVVGNMQLSTQNCERKPSKLSSSAAR